MPPQAAIVGVGYSNVSRSSSSSVLELAYQACLNAVLDAGLEPQEIDGVGSYMLMHDSVPCQALATVLALPELRYSLDLQMGGQAPCHLVWQAAAAVATGQARNIVVFRAMKGRSGKRVGTMRFEGPAADFRYPIGYDAYMMYVAMWAQRFLHDTGQSSIDLGAVAIAQREYAADNERAIRRTPLDIESYLAAPYVVEPFRGADCTTEIDGACALVISSLPQARDLRHPPAVLAAGAYRAGTRPGLDIGDHLAWDDYSTNYTSLLRNDLYRSAGICAADIEIAEIYDCFTSTVLMGLEGLGLCERGASGAFVRSGQTRLDGSLPCNTNGGLLSEGYLHGMNTVAEGALQVQGRAGIRQARKHEICVVTSGALMDGSALILAADR